MIVHRVKVMNRAESLYALSEFNIGDRVSWSSRDGNVYDSDGVEVKRDVGKE